MKTLIILRALPGSGKSTLAQKLESDYNVNAVICSNDDYLYYGKEKTQENYNWTLDGAYEGFLSCFDKFKKSVADSEDLIIIDNTNILKKDFKEFVRIGVENNYDTIIHSITGFSAMDSFKTNIHNVPLEFCLKKFKDFKACTNPIEIKGFQYNIKEILHDACDIRKGIYGNGSF